MIKLNNGYFIESDSLQFTLKQKVSRNKKDTGEEYEAEITHGYYFDLSAALKGYTRKVMLDYTHIEAISLYQVLDKLKEIHEEIKAYE